MRLVSVAALRMIFKARVGSILNATTVAATTYQYDRLSSDVNG